MKSTAIILTILSWTLLLFTCTPDPLNVEEVPTLRPHIVVSSQIVPGQSIAVLLTRSIGALDAGATTNATELLNHVLINDATVTVTYKNKTDTLHLINDGVYGSVNTPLITGEGYTLTVNSPSMGKVKATTYMKNHIKFDSARIQFSYNGYDSLVTVDYQFTDPPGPNWYMINVQRLTHHRDPTEFLNPRVATRLLSDEAFDGNVYKETYAVTYRKFWPGDTVGVFLANISEDYYHYLTVRANSQGDLSALVADPLNLPTNVQGGFGYFNMHSPDIRMFTLK